MAIAASSDIIKVALQEQALTAQPSLSLSQFQKLASSSTADQKNVILYLAAETRLGISAVSKETYAELCGLFDRLTGARPSGKAFTATALSDLCTDIGFTSDFPRAVETLMNSRAVAEGAVQPSEEALHAVKEMRAGRGHKLTKPALLPLQRLAVPLGREEFADCLAAAAVDAQVDEDRIRDYLRVFYLMHLSGIREQAGVASLTGQ